LDLAEQRQVTKEEAEKFAQEEGLLWSEVSAKTGEGIKEIFQTIGVSPSAFFPPEIIGADIDLSPASS
jgi:Ras-related protein Rab-5C